MKDFGEIKKALDVEIERDRVQGTVCLSWKQYLQKILSKLGFDKYAKLVTILLAPHFKLSSQLSLCTDEKCIAQVLYVIDSLMYVMVHTRPDIFQTISMVIKYMHNFGKGHRYAIMWILQYILGTLDVRLKFVHDEYLGQ